MLLLDVYNKAEVKVDAESKGRLLTLLRSFPSEEPTKKRFMGEVVGWSARCGEYPAGEPEVCHVCGTIFAAGKFGRWGSPGVLGWKAMGRRLQDA